MVRSYQDSHVSKKNFTEEPKMGRKISYELLDIDKNPNQKNIKIEVMEKQS